MADQLQLRRGTTSQILGFTGAQGEVVVNTDTHALVVQDGITAGGFPSATSSQVNNGTFYYNEDAGSAANAYILIPKANTNTPSSYLSGVQFGFVTAFPNTGPSTANFQGLGVKNLKYPGGVDPLAGEISGRTYLIYDQVNDWMEIQRKALGQPPQIRTVGASVSGGALTVSLAPCSIDFRSPTASSGAVLSRIITSPISLVIPSGATLGTTSALISRLAVIAIDNSGTVELAVVNLASAPLLDETLPISTTTISAAASSASVIYSAVARINVSYRVVGFVTSTQVTAGSWSTSPSQIQGQGGQNQIGVNIATGIFTASTSGTSIDFTGIPGNVKRITLALAAVSTNGASPLQVQLGTSGGIVSVGYLGASDAQASGGGTAAAVATGLGLERTGAPTSSSARSGLAVFNRLGLNLWVGTWLGSSTGTAYVSFGSTAIQLPGELDRIRLTTINGTDAFDAGSINVLYEI